MLSKRTIPKQKTAEPARNQEMLYALGLEHAQRLASRIWTDYNVHDPGVTTLELLCYALTDLGYRASFPVKDLLASSKDNAKGMKNQFFTARQILPNRALTLLDYRKLLIDLKGVKNAWVQPATVTYYADMVVGELQKANSGKSGVIPVNLQGIYDVIIDYVDDLKADDRATVMDSVRERLHANRNLCEDFAAFDEVEKQWFVICAELELTPDADVESVEAEIYFQTQQYLAPAVANYTLTEMLARKHKDGSAFTVDEIFNGPSLDCGFIADDELAAAELRTEIRLSDVISIIMDIKGVRAVREIVINGFLKFSMDDLRDGTSLVAKLKSDAGAVSVYIRGRLSMETKAELATWVPPAKPPTRLLMLVVENLNAILEGELLYEEARFLGVKLREETRTLLESRPTGGNRMRLNRLLLEDAYTVELSRNVYSPHGSAVQADNKWIVPVATRKKASLNQEHSRLVYYKRNMPVFAGKLKVKEYLDARVAAVRTTAETAVAYDLDIPIGKYRAPNAYYSFQNHFPAVYGLSEQGLSSEADENRKALALQLKAYLLFFDQIMANYLAQLSHAKDLLTNDPALTRTYFAQVVDSFADHEKIYDAGPLAQLEGALEDKAAFAERRQRFLDHLISRFAERFTDFANIMYSAFRSNPADMIPLKCEFLQHYPAISSERSLAYNYSLKKDADLWNSANVSGLEKRLAKLLGIRNFTRRNLSEITYDIYAEVDATPGDEFRWRVRHRETGDIILSSSKKYTTAKLAKKEMQTAISFALIPTGYQRKVAADRKHFFNIVDDTGEIVARRIEYFDTSVKMEQAITELTQYLQIYYSDEGMYLIEPILLRWAANPDPFLPICPEPNCTDCAEADPYSYRFHVILPAYASRFANMDFRRFVEEVIREEAPAHILPRVCWISRDDMAVLEKAYRDWIYIRSGAETAGRSAKLKAFIEILFSVRNVYPPRQLHECDNGEDKPKFLLGQSALGSMKEET